MSRIDLHPDDLFDLARSGGLTHGQTQRLRAHAHDCAACALEIGWLSDALHARAPSEDDTLRAQASLQRLLCEQPDLRVLAAARPRRSRSASFGIALAVLLSAGAAAAAFGGPGARWLITRAAPLLQAVSGAAAAKPAAKFAVQAGHAPEPEAHPATLQPTASTPTPLPTAASQSDIEHTGPSAMQLLGRAQLARAHGDRERALRLLQIVARRFPGSDVERATRVSRAGLLLEQTADASGALRLYDEYLADVGSASLAEEAQFGRAQCLERLRRWAEARAAWQALVLAHPTSLHCALARRRVSELTR